MLTSEARWAVAALAIIIVFELVPMLWDPIAERLSAQSRTAAFKGRNEKVRPTEQGDSFFTRVENEDYRSRLLMAAAQILLVALGLFGAFGHAFYRADYSRTLNLDMVTIAWIGLAVIGLILPQICPFGFEDAEAGPEQLGMSTEHIEHTSIDVTKID